LLEHDDPVFVLGYGRKKVNRRGEADDYRTVPTRLVVGPPPDSRPTLIADRRRRELMLSLSAAEPPTRLPDL
jgi:hypothetical protein